MAYRYFKSPNIIHDIRYGPHARNFLDIYVPPGRRTAKNRLYPVVVFFTGGAWTIGYKGWSGLFSDSFMEKGFLYVTPDYRNFPQGYGNEMVQDVERSIIWVTQNIKAYGGDPNNITVVGQSAGAHLSSLVLVRKATAEFEAGLEKCDLTKSWSVELDHSRPKWSINQIKRYIGVSGPYDLAGYVGYLHGRGLPNYLLYSIFQGELTRFSPMRIAKRFAKKYLTVDKPEHPRFRFPTTAFFHGTADLTMPSKASEEFAKALEELGVDVNVNLYPGKTHTDCIMEDIFLGNNVMLDDLINSIIDIKLSEQEFEQEQDLDVSRKNGEQKDDGHQAKAELKWRRLSPAYYPAFLVRMAQRVNPF
jgi:prenylcysteine alpha-carboxyl methylesterase